LIRYLASVHFWVLREVSWQTSLSSSNLVINQVDSKNRG